MIESRFDFDIATQIYVVSVLMILNAVVTVAGYAGNWSSVGDDQERAKYRLLWDTTRTVGI